MNRRRARAVSRVSSGSGGRGVRMVSVGSELPGVLAVGQRATGIFAVGQEARGFIAIGQLATGVIAIGQLALGVVAIGQLARGVIAAGQLAVGLAAAGQVAAGVVWCPGLGVGGFSGSPVAFGFFGRLRKQRLIVWLHRKSWDQPPRWPAWRRAVAVAGFAALAAGWWFLAGQPLLAVLRLYDNRHPPLVTHGWYRAAMGIPLSDSAWRLVEGKNYAVVATVNPDGSPQTSVIWVGRDGDDLVFSTVEGRLKHRNMVRDPRVSISIIDSADPENYVELRGRVTMTPDVGRRVDTELSWKYDGKDPGEDRPGAVRVVVRMAIEKAAGYAA